MKARWLPAAPLPGVQSIPKEGRRTLFFIRMVFPCISPLTDCQEWGAWICIVSRKQDDGTWSEPENLGYPINTHGDENSLQVFADGSHAIFATDRSDAGKFGPVGI